MATGVCYTQSGSTKKYEDSLSISLVKGSYITPYITNNVSNGVNNYSFPDPSTYEFSSKGPKDDNMPLIFVTYYPSTGNNPCYFNYEQGYDKWDVYIQIINLTIYNSSNFGDCVKISELNNRTLNEIYNSENKESKFDDTFLTIKNNELSQSQSIDVNLTIKIDAYNVKFEKGEVNFIIYAKTHGSTEKMNLPSYGGNFNYDEYQYNSTSKIYDTKNSTNYAAGFKYYAVSDNNGKITKGYVADSVDYDLLFRGNINSTNNNYFELINNITGVYENGVQFSGLKLIGMKNRFHTYIPAINLNITLDCGIDNIY